MPASSSDCVDCPAISSLPEVGRSSRPMILSSVLLPEPYGPLERDKLGGLQGQTDAMQHLGFDFRADVVAATDVGQAQAGSGWGGHACGLL